MADPLTHSHDTATPALSVESEYVLVPREPTEAMLDAFWLYSGESNLMRLRTHDRARSYFSAMIAAAPAPNPSPAAKGGEAKRKIANPFLPGGLGTRLLTAIHAYRKDYVYSTDDVEHIPTEWEAVLLEDFVAGIGGDDAFGEIIRDAALATPSPQPADAVREAVDAVQVTLQRILDATVASTNSRDAKQGLDWAKVVAQSAIDDLAKLRAALASDPAPSSPDLEVLRAENEAYRNAARDMLNNWRFGNFYAPQQPEPLYVRKFAQLHKAGSDRIASQVIARSQAASDPAPAGEAVEPVEDDESEDTTRLWWFLHILAACGKHGTYANDEPGEWVAAFCDDAEPTDTFNLACNLKLAICTHNSMDETSRIWISDAGKAWLAAHPAPEDTARLREDLERVTRELEEETALRVGAIDRMKVAERERDDAWKALEPFAAASRGLADCINDNSLVWAREVAPREYALVTAGDLRAARSASREGASDE